MSHTNFEALPLELRQRIAYYLSADFRAGYPIPISDKGSLVALAQAGRSGYEAAAPFLWKTLFFHIDWEDSRRLAEAVDHCTRVLERNMGFQYVRSIQLLLSPNFSQSHLRDEEQEDFDLDYEDYDDEYDDYGDYDDYDDDHDGIDTSTTYYEIPGQALQHLVTLIQRIPLLAHFYFLGAEKPVPTRLLRVLKTNQPQCKLWYYGPRIWFCGLSIPAIFYETARSPLLANLRMVVEREDLSDFFQWYPLILSNVRHLKIKLPASMLWYDGNPEIIQGLVPYSNSHTDLSALETLELNGFRDPWDTETITKTSMIPQRDLDMLNLCNLVRLSLNTIPPWLSLGSLTAPRGSLFPKLQELLIKTTEVGSFPVDLHREAISFLQSLFPLRLLKMPGFLTQISLEKILECHPSLEDLQIGWDSETANVVKHGHLLLICKYGHQLRSLSISYERSQGSHVEAALYSIIGRLPRLQHLELLPHRVSQDLYGPCSPLPGPRASNLTMPLFDQQPVTDVPIWRPGMSLTQGMIRGLLINQAMDENLARGIFQTISAGKVPGSLPLKSLKIHSGPGISIPGSAWGDFLNLLAKAFLITRHEQDGCGVRIDVQELYAPSQSYIDRLTMPCELMRLFDSVWPNSGHWMDSWHSFPLATTDDSETP